MDFAIPLTLYWNTMLLHKSDISSIYPFSNDSSKERIITELFLYNCRNVNF